VLLSMQHRSIPPTAGTVELDDDMNIDVVIVAARPWIPAPAMSNNFGFGGHNGSIIVGPA
ncbi:MAG: beta-ketoacyl synthase, partial [Actinomycetes bacterium]